MAITIRTQPATHTPAYNEQWFIAIGSNYTQTNFNYVVTTTVDGVSQTQKIPVRPDNGMLYFNPQSIVESFVSPKFYNELDEPYQAPYEVKKVTVVIAEEYGSPVSGFTGTSGTYYVWNSAYNSKDFASYTYSTTTSAKTLSLAPQLTDTISFDQYFLLKSWHNGFSSRSLYQLVVKTYDSSLLQTQETVIQNDYYDPSTNEANFITHVDCSPRALNLIKTNKPANIISQSFPAVAVVPIGTYYYEYYWKDSGGNTSSETGKVYTSNYCSNYTRYVLHFLNRLGNFDSFTFNLVNKKTIEKATKDYRKVPYVLDGNYNYKYKTHESDKVTFSTVLTNKITLNSNWVTDAQISWLMDLFRSPYIILENTDGTIEQVTCTVKNFEEKQKANEKIFNVTIDLEYDYQDVRQRR